MYSIKILDKETFFPLFEKFRPIVFEEVQSYLWRDILSPREIEAIKTLDKNVSNRYELHLGVFNEKDEFIGWSSGYQSSKDSFCMMNSGVLKEYQRQGIYSALLKKNLEILTEKGFQVIWSRHCATNNAVIIPKLKVGFIITSLELDDGFGTLIQLRYYTNPTRRKIMDYRCGQSKPDDERRFYLQMARLICDLRMKSGMTQSELAKSAGVSQPLIASLERGDQNRTPSFETIYKILRVLGYKMEINVLPLRGKAA